MSVVSGHPKVVCFINSLYGSAQDSIHICGKSKKKNKTTANHNFSNFQAFCDISVNIGFLRQVETIR